MSEKKCDRCGLDLKDTDTEKHYHISSTNCMYALIDQLAAFQKELAEAKAEIERVKNIRLDMARYIDVDNLTMQINYKEWMK